MARITGTWLTGPPTDSGDSEAPGYRGELYGLPREGVGSLASSGRRVGALFLDWFIGVGVAAVIVGGFGSSTVPLLCWFVIGVIAVTLFGFTPGQYFLKLRVGRIDANAPVGFVRALARQVLIVFVVPALFTDADGRGMHDRATGTALVIAR
ncbi:RDD family protein [Nocardia camponoti]|uniref:RDD family protein n=1 Tax=Nocardia camponoti TaxID=1616106 RepID=A0A917VBZ4_9NOCA|nr:RDD family protein [Nocardia camponoti]GGK61277.1 RDD family protein [Nocardia camponoti]